MSGEALPEAVRPLVSFAAVLRANRFPASPEQTVDFLEAVRLLGPRGMHDIRQAALALYAPDVERRGEFDSLFRAHFMGQSLAAPALAEDAETLEISDFGPGEAEYGESQDIDESGSEAAAIEALSAKSFGARDESNAHRRFRRKAPDRLPRRRSNRFASSRTGGSWNMRRILRDAVRHDGDAFLLARMDRKARQRRILLLLDISGSMKEGTDGALRFAHPLDRAAERVKIFAMGTRLTRITPAVRRRNLEQALAEVEMLVEDWDGGTRIGDSLQAFLSVTRFTGFARGAVVVIVSDGLERGDATALSSAVQRLRRLAWRLHWLSPLAGGAGYAPETEAIKAILPDLDVFGDGGSGDALCTHMLEIAGSA